MERQPKHRKWIHIIFIVAIFGILALAARHYFSQYDKFNSENLEAFIRGYGPWAILVYALIYIISSPIPFVAIVLSAVGGLLFGPIVGPIVVVFIATGSSLVPFTMAKQLGREWVESKLEGKKLQEIYRQSEGRKAFTFILLMRLIPILPWEVQNYVAGLTKVSLPTYLLATMVGIIPGSASLVLLGSAAKEPNSWQFYVTIGMNIVVMAIPSVALFIRSRKKRGEQ